MKKILHAHPTVVIGTLAVVFVAIVAALYSWAIGAAVIRINEALAPPPMEAPQSFELSAASKLDLRGLINTSSSSGAASSTY